MLEQLARITLRGDLIRLDDGLWALPRSTPEKTARTRPETTSRESIQRVTRDRLVAGKLDLHRDGFGFVRPNGSSAREDDLFIPPNELNGAMQGDEVLVDEAPPGRDGRRSGHILRILTRRNPTVVGIFHYARPHGRRTHDYIPDSTARFNFVTPLDERMTQPILIPDGADGRTAHCPEAPDAPPCPWRRGPGPAFHDLVSNWITSGQVRLDPLEGLAVDIEDHRLSHRLGKARPRSRSSKSLATPDAFGVDVEIVIRKHHLPHVFPANVLAEAERIRRSSHHRRFGHGTGCPASRL